MYSVCNINLRLYSRVRLRSVLLLVGSVPIELEISTGRKVGNTPKCTSEVDYVTF
jgi:hypothetical protein